MPLAEFKTYKKSSNFRKNEFIDLSIGRHTIRILTQKAVVRDTHYSRGVTMLCLGDDCPICQNNRKMFMEHGKEASNMPGFVGQRQVAYVNVLDRTPAKICPNTECQAEIKKVGNVFPPTCPKCGASLVAVQASPLNKVKILSKGKKFFDQVEYYNTAILDENETPIGVTNFDLEVLVLDGKTAPTVSSKEENIDVVNVPEDALFDLDSALLKLTPDEILEVLRGVRLADIFAARKATATTSTTASTNQALASKIADDVDGIFEN